MQEFSTYPKAKRLIQHLANNDYDEAIETLELYTILKRTEGDFIAARFLVNIYEELIQKEIQVKLINV